MIPAEFPNRGPEVEVVALTTLGVATLFVAARLVTRLGIAKKSTWDDLLIVVGWILALGVSLSITFGVAKGLGRHDDDIPPQSLDGLRKCEYSFTVLYVRILPCSCTREKDGSGWRERQDVRMRVVADSS